MPKADKNFDPHNPTCPGCKKKLQHIKDVITLDYLPDHVANVYNCTCGAIVTVVVAKDPTRN